MKTPEPLSTHAQQQVIAMMISTIAETSPPTRSFSEKKIALFTKVLAAITKPGAKRLPNTAQLNDALCAYPKLFKAFSCIKSYGREQRIAVALGHASIPICPVCDNVANVGQTYCCNECRAADPKVITARETGVETRHKKFDSLVKKLTPNTYTSDWTEKHVALFTKIYNRAGLNNQRVVYKKLVLAMVDKAPKLLSRFLGIRATRTGHRTEVALGQRPIAFCEQCSSVAPVGKSFCSPECMYANEGRKEKQVRGMKETWMARHGVDNMSKIPHVRAAIKDKHGVEFYTQSTEFKAKLKATNKKRYGTEYYFNSAEFEPKRKAGMMAKYGVGNPQQNAEIHERTQDSLYRRKEFKVGRRIVKLQGYEPQAVTYLLSLGIKASSFAFGLTEGVPSFRYKNPKRDNALSVYHPDFMVTHKGKKIIVEVKSVYTLIPDRLGFKVNLRKAKAVIQAGFDYRLIVMDSLGASIELPNNWMQLNWSSISAHFTKLGFRIGGSSGMTASRSSIAAVKSHEVRSTRSRQVRAEKIAASVALVHASRSAKTVAKIHDKIRQTLLNRDPADKQRQAAGNTMRGAMRRFGIDIHDPKVRPVLQRLIDQTEWDGLPKTQLAFATKIERKLARITS